MVPKVRTFDVFDTVLTRRVVDPLSVFLLLGQRLPAEVGDVVSPVSFARLRARAERDAISMTERGHPTLTAIYGQLASQLGLRAPAVKALVDAEIDLERRLSVVVPAGVELLEAARRAGCATPFVSDMYLPTEIVRTLLADAGVLREEDRVFVSVEGLGSKSRGDLYPHVLTELGVHAGDVVHCGDNVIGDIRRARESGIATEHFTAAHANRYERRLEDFRWESDGLSSVFAGASRLCRLNGGDLDARGRVIREVAAGVVAPILTGYVLWVLRTARRYDLQRLYFVSRDGEILLDIARRVAPLVGSEVELRYLYGSRQSWLPAGVDPDCPAEAVEALWHDVDTSLDNMLARCGLEPTMWVESTTAGRDGQIARVVLEELLARPDFLHAVTSGLNARQARLERYLRDAGLFDGAASGVVDLGWRGVALDHLARLLSRSGADVPRGIYLSVADGPLRQPVDTWFPRGSSPLRPFMMEVFCAGTEGQTVDFTTDDSGTPVPVLREPSNSHALSWGLEEVRRTVNEFLDHLSDAGDLAHLSGDVRSASHAVFSEFYDRPTREEARVWGTFPYERDLVSADVDQLAYGRTLRQSVIHRVRPHNVRIRWPAGSEVLSSTPWRGLHRTQRGLLRLPANARTAARRFRTVLQGHVGGR